MNHYFITGTSRGIGKALAELLLEKADNSVTGVSRSSTIEHARYTHITADLSDVATLEQQIEALFPPISEAGRVVLVNNAGVLGDIGYVGESSTEHFKFVLDVNLVAVAMLMNAFLKVYSTHPGPKTILNVSSGAGKHPIDGWAAYCASKAGLDMLSQVTAREQELRQNGARIFALSPGVVNTEMQDQIRQADPGQFSSVQRFKDYHRNNELQDPAEVAHKIKQILDNEEKYNEVLVSLPR